MKKNSPYNIIKHQYVTEKSNVLQELKNAESNRSVKRCQSPKYVFIVDKRANKQEIRNAVMEIYKEKKVKVVSVNTINQKPKAKRVRGRLGMTAGFKKAIVTLDTNDSIDTQ